MLHSSVTVTPTHKTCDKCLVPKAIAEFRRADRNADGRRNTCKECMNKQAKPALLEKKKEKDYWSQFMPI